MYDMLITGMLQESGGVKYFKVFDRARAKIHLFGAFLANLFVDGDKAPYCQY